MPETQKGCISLGRDDAHVCIDKELQRVSKRTPETLNKKDVYFVFPPLLPNTSTTYKLKLNHGDLKATQGDTGHAQIDMITDIYAHILDEDRKVNAMKFEQAFYNINADLRSVRAPQEEQQPSLDVATLIEQLQKSPELLQTLSQLISAKQ